MCRRMSKKEQYDKFEKVLRDLLKHPGNRRCINCDSLGPQYVCTTFCTFVCTTCSGIHREFTHRIKSISMAKFTAEEVLALQTGGNERAKQIYLKEWDPQRHSLPDNSNLNRIRDFVKHVYEDRRYTGERSREFSTRTRVNKRRESCDNKTLALYIGGRADRESTSTGKRTVERTLKYYFERGDPGFKEEHYGMQSTKTPSATFEVVDDRVKNDDRKNRGGFPLNLFRNRNSPGSEFHHSHSKTPSLDEKFAHLQRVEEPKPTEKKPESSTEMQISQVNAQLKAKPQQDNNVKDEPKTQQEADVKDSQIRENDATEEPKPLPPQAPPKNSVEFLLHELSGPLVATSEQKHEALEKEVKNHDTLENMESSLEALQLDNIQSSSNKNEAKLLDLLCSSSHDALESEEANKSPNIQSLSNENVHISYVTCSPEDSTLETQEKPIGNESSLENANLETEEKPTENALSFENAHASLEIQDNSLGNELALEIATSSASERSVENPSKSPKIEREELPEDLFSARFLPPPTSLSGWPAASPAVQYANMQRSHNPFDPYYADPVSLNSGHHVGMYIANNSQGWIQSDGATPLHLPYMPHQPNNGICMQTEGNGVPMKGGNPFD